MISRMQTQNNTPFLPTPSVDFSKIKVGVKTLEDAVLTINGDKKRANPKYSDKIYVLNTIRKMQLDELCDISNYYFKVSGIYSRLCRYMAYLYCYDWMVTPYVQDDSKEDEETKKKILKNFNNILNFLDNFEIKRFFGEVALKVIRNGCYYGYIIRENGKIAQVQELPFKYCRTRYSVNGRPAVEMNMKYFDDAFRNAEYRLRVLKLFPKEFKKAYMLYKQGKLKDPTSEDSQGGWYLLDPTLTIKFNIGDSDLPLFISVIPTLIDLDNAQDLDRQRMAQQLLKIIIQKMPLDKNGTMVFDPDEAAQLHRNAMQMVGKAIGVDVLTTYADIDVEDVADSSAAAASTDDLERIERQVYNEAGTAQMLFNTNGNIALEKSILNDEATMYNLIQKFESFLNYLIKPFNKSKSCTYRVTILKTTTNNFKELSKIYKEQTQIGYSKMLPAIAIGQSQSSVLANAYFENDILDLVNVFIPPLSSNVINAEILNRGNNNSNNNNGNEEAGRPEKPDDEKSEKTILNKESSK